MAFAWCQAGQHDKCPREYERFLVDPKTNKVIMLGETAICQCAKRGCACYVPARERNKPNTRKRKK